MNKTVVKMIMALYLRLSKEDGDLVDESNSITNQRYILRKYMDEMPDSAQYQIKEYIDDGYSGKNFERPGIQQLLEDVKHGQIAGILVKDFSRFGRNYIEVGNLIEKIFPLLDVRFIAVNNHFDSINYQRTTPDMDVAFENLMYDYFSEENSIKIRNDLLQKRMRGKYMATFAAYGYKKAKKDHNQILVDEEAAGIVRLIFQLYIQSGVKADVARYLNERNIPTPQEYARRKGVVQHWKYEEGKKLWNGSIIGRILRNPIYIGNTVFHKKEVTEVGARRTKCLPESEWKTCENTHAAIVSKEVFEQVQRMEMELKEKERSRRDRGVNAEEGERVHGVSGKYCEGEKRLRGKGDSAIKGLVKCGGCRHNMLRRNRKNATYYCRSYYEGKVPGCCQENIREDSLLEIVRDAVRRQAMLASDLRELTEQYATVTKQRKDQAEKERKQIQGKLQKCRDESFSLYERYKREEISGKEFQAMREKNLKQQEAFQCQLKQCGEETANVSADMQGILSLLEGKENLPELTREVVDELISSIYVYGKDRVEIVFRFQDALGNLLSSTKRGIS